MAEVAAHHRFSKEVTTMNNCRRLLQLTNNTIGAVGINDRIPVGVVTRRIMRDTKCQPTFEVTTNANNAVTISEAGIYTITYTGSLEVGAAGDIVLQLLYNGVVANTVTVTAAAAGTYSVNLSFVVRILGNCCSGQQNLPALLQINNAGIALTGGTGNLIIEGNAL